jgi:hypothetical protein
VASDAEVRRVLRRLLEDTPVTDKPFVGYASAVRKSLRSTHF